MKKALLIFDQYVDIDHLRRRLKFIKVDLIYLFPLTSKQHVIDGACRACRSNDKSRVEINLLESARLIDDEVNRIRGRVSDWVSGVGDYNIRGRSIKEWLLIPDDQISTWWFSVLAEKNTLKTDSFFKIAQINAIAKMLDEDKYNSCIFSICEKELTAVLNTVCDNRSLTKVKIPSIKAAASFKTWLNGCDDEHSFFKLILKSAILFCVPLVRSIKAKTMMGPTNKRTKVEDKPILFISYFPAIDKDAAKNGILKNKFAASLQQKMRDMGKRIIWIWMYIPMDGYSYDDALKLAKKFSYNEEVNFFIDEFLSVKSLKEIFKRYMRQLRILFCLRKYIKYDEMCRGLTIPEACIFVRHMITKSFIGWTALEGIYYLEIYKNIMNNFSHVSQCVYLAEMHAWEKALNAAKNVNAKKMKTIGFQHSNVAQNYFHYSCSRKDMGEKRASMCIPLPDVLACNGDIPHSLLSASNFTNIAKVEAIRQLYLTGHLKDNELSNLPKSKILLVAGSYNMVETGLMVSLLHAAFPNAENFKIWVNGHPSTSISDTFNMLHIDPKKCGYEIKDGPIEEHLRPAQAVIVGISNVALESLALGCEIFVPVYSERIFISPLGGFDGFYTKIYNPSQLRDKVNAVMSRGCKTDKDIKDARDFIKNYWCLDNSLKRWESVLR